VKIVVDDLSGPEISEFLAEHVRQMRSITPLESKHALDLDALRRPGITFWSVLDGGTLVGCGAIKRLDASHAEVKSMRTAPARHRSGIASLLLGHVIAEAGRMGFARLSLETGSTEFFRPARNLYEKFGFEYCGPFGDYRPDPNSVFMTRTLPLGSARRRPPQGPRCQPVRRFTMPSLPAEQFDDVQPVQRRPPVAVAQNPRRLRLDGRPHQPYRLIAIRRGFPRHLDHRGGTEPLVVLGEPGHDPEPAPRTGR
jgi:putative acetyltransferase